MRSILLAGWIILGVRILSTAPCGSQEPASSSPNFVVATIRPSDPDSANTEGNIGFSPDGSFKATSQSLKELIEFLNDISSYDVDQRLIGGPKWIGSAKFDITAKCDEATAGTFEKMRVNDQIHAEQAMVQTLLADRFRLRMHHETRQLPVYTLVLAHGGSKMRSSTATTDELNDADGSPGNWKAKNVTMKAFAHQLASLPEIGGKIVVDTTGLNGSFDFALRWTPDMMDAAPPSYDHGLKSDAAPPSLRTALEEQLGLRLETTKAPVDVIVIDSVEQPSPN
jgi:uncharacterized protein (TIGR03435 family)